MIAADDAEFGMPEVRLGVPTIVGAMRLPRRIGMQPTLELLLTGERIDAVRAQEIGLAGRVVPRADLMDEALRLAAPALPGRAARRPGGQGDGVPRASTCRGSTRVRMGETMRRVAAQTDDAREGMAAAREGRDPRWTGR